MIYDPIPVIIFIIFMILLMEFPVFTIIAGIIIFCLWKDGEPVKNDNKDIQMGHDNIHRD